MIAGIGRVRKQFPTWLEIEFEIADFKTLRSAMLMSCSTNIDIVVLGRDLLALVLDFLRLH